MVNQLISNFEKRHYVISSNDAEILFGRSKKTPLKYYVIVKVIAKPIYLDGHDIGVTYLVSYIYSLSNIFFIDKRKITKFHPITGRLIEVNEYCSRWKVLTVFFDKHSKRVETKIAKSKYSMLTTTVDYFLKYWPAVKRIIQLLHLSELL
jgi:hypothetical protein